jgi:RNAse (barnase) inhibitor barstar
MRPARWLTVTTDPAPAVVDGRAARTRAAFFEEVARVLDFPPYFGGNWDALVDCLRDVAAADLVVAHAHELLTAEEPSQFAILLDIMARAAADGLTLTLCTDPDQKASLRRRIDAALRQD